MYSLTTCQWNCLGRIVVASHCPSRWGDGLMVNKWQSNGYDHERLKIIQIFFGEYIHVFEYTCTLHSFPQIYSNHSLYKFKWNNYFLISCPCYILA